MRRHFLSIQLALHSDIQCMFSGLMGVAEELLYNNE